MKIEISKKFLSGFIFGLGFSAALAISVSLSIDHYIEKLYTQAQEVAASFEKEDWEYSLESHMLSISNDKSRIDDEGIVVTGVLSNSDVVEWGSITIEMEIFNSSGVFVHECTTRLHSPVAPGGRENFKISCGKAISNAPEYSTYKLRVVSANNI